MKTWWRLGTVVTVLSIAACGGDPPELHLDVVRTGEEIHVMAYEVARPDACPPRPFVELGETSYSTDVVSCDGSDPATPTAWLGEVRVMQGAQLVARTAYDAPYGAVATGLFAGQTGLRVEVDGDGQTIALALPDVPTPIPVIDDIVQNGGPVTVTWHATPAAASVRVSASNGFGGPITHQPAPAPVVIPWTSDVAGFTFRVEAYAAPATIVTDFGQAHVWTGAAVERQLPVP
ncbi:MAG: hypothetical protein K8W52_12765 [Deltaproteobacteria bacterium]|nr:hypothetical protein [Deltaproteobacteria bacterium]